LQLFHQIEAWLADLSARIPVELFIFFGAFIEEVIAPIPSPLVLTLAGSIAFSQKHALVFLLWLSLVGTVGKTLGAWLVYFIADKLEDVIVGRFGKFIGVAHKDVEGIGKHFKGGWKDYFILFILRALPVIPSAPLSVVCGIIKINLRTYLVATFLGTYVRNLIFLYIGYAGVATYTSLLGGLESIESVVQILVLVGFVGLIVWAYTQRKKGVSFNWFKNKNDK